jgi:NitT/TauT family transport system substrate-binding protein
MLQASPIGLMALETAGISDLSALVGRKIGLHAYNRPQLAIMLASAGLKPADVEVIEIGDDVDSLATGRIAAQVCYLIDEPVALERRGFKLKTFPGYQHGYTGYAQVYFTTEATLAADPALLRSFLRASNEGWRLALADPEKTAALIVQKYLPGGDAAYQAESLRKMSGPLVAETGWTGIGQMRRATWEQSARLGSVATGVVLQTLLDGFLDASVLRSVYPAWNP